MEDNEEDENVLENVDEVIINQEGGQEIRNPHNSCSKYYKCFDTYTCTCGAFYYYIFQMIVEKIESVSRIWFYEKLMNYWK